MSAIVLPTRGAILLAQALAQPLALLPGVRDQLVAIVERHARGESADIAAIEARLGRPLANPEQGYQVVDGVAVLPLQGVVMPKMNLLMQISGGTSAQLLERDVRAAGADPKVRGIVLSVDSPGGSTLGTPEAGRAIREVAAVKPLAAHTDGTMASAAFWIASAANAIFASGPTVQIGSIGVVATHVDRSLADRDAGVQRTEITAGKYKRIASDTGPLSAEGAATIQAQVDYLYSLFCEQVAENRGASVATVLSDMADGRIFIGRQAIDAGLADGTSSLDDLVRAMSANPNDFARRRTARRGGPSPIPTPAAPTRAPAGASAAGEPTMARAPDKYGAQRAFAAAETTAVVERIVRAHAMANGGAPETKSARKFTEQDAQEYAQRVGVRVATARAALGVEPPGAPDVERTRQETVDRMVALHMQASGSSTGRRP